MNKRNWPKPIGREAKIGILGSFISDLLPKTESDEAALIFQFIIAFGNIVGNVPHIKVEETKHSLNLFCVLVGQSSKGRKGTSWNHIKSIFKEIDIEWGKSCLKEGLTSGEGLTYHVRDAVEMENVVVDPGVDDKRLLITESEFASVLRNTSREGNILSPVLRQAWDGNDLATLTKNNPNKSTSPHISIIGHITEKELIKNLKTTEYVNGFGNRFLWLVVKRSSILPFGGSLTDEQKQFYKEHIAEVVIKSQNCGDLTLSEQAREKWTEIYYELAEKKFPGVLEDILGRAEPIILRLSGIYALLDGSNIITDLHLSAAKELWRYCTDSCCYIFGQSSGNSDADKVHKAIIDKGKSGLTRSDINHPFNRNKKQVEIEKILRVLESSNLAYSKLSSKGNCRVETWYSVKNTNSYEFVKKQSDNPRAEDSMSAPAMPASEFCKEGQEG